MLKGLQVGDRLDGKDSTRKLLLKLIFIVVLFRYKGIRDKNKCTYHVIIKTVKKGYFPLILKN